ncbi:D-alanyl-D-alanine carboxypeptidase [Sporosarcina sp. ACRSL]|uniref:D-alanyl-D-alanine carboxypeptidase family protein n=1 Tax=Sporosarcina sp. ACRSL TaxID=2918215 RepID=UPI001EF5422B|nr:D-alanyl-D-alanine carboxypeptidase family protein [Sporosarcina sp. ACRSL]MCG7343419.1 D-alanyl-D-alanine carboxypeptidase [Sporosarcina sp. ACRSL]
MKKTLTILIVAALAFFIFIKEKDARKETNPLYHEAKAAIVLEAETGKILYEQNSKEALPIASMSKLMTQYIVLEAIADGRLSWDSQYKPSTAALNQPRYAVMLGMDKRKTYNVRELFAAMTITSANDAAVALAELVSGTEAEFVQEMNKKAEQFGLTNTRFINATGLDEADTNHATARDVAAIANELLEQYPEVLEFTRMTDFTTSDGTRLWTTNLMLPGMPQEMIGMEGLKTGYTEEAGPCFASTGIYEGKRIITVVMGVGVEGSDTSTPRFTLTRDLIDRYVLNE